MSKSPWSRRAFLQTTAGIAGASLVGGSTLLDTEQAFAATTVAASDRIRFGIVGVGMEGSGLLNTAVLLPGVECVAAADLYDGRHQLAREIVGKPIRTTRRYQDLLDAKDVDAVIVAVPDHWHKQVVIDALAAGKDVYCEKPMSHNPADGLAMVAAAKKTDRIVQVGAQRTSSVLCARAKELYDKGAIGELNLVEATFGRNDPTGAWEYPPPPDLSPQNLDWEMWQGTAPKKAFDPNTFARWRCWKEYGTGVAGDLLAYSKNDAAGDWNWPIDPGAGPDAAGDGHIDWEQWLGSAPKRPFDADRFFRFRKYWDYSGGIATDLHYHIVAPFHVAVANEFPTRVSGMGGLWVYKDAREVPDTFLTAADYPSKYSMTIQSSQVNEHGPVTTIRGTKATINLSDEWEGPPSRQYDYADIVPESPYIDEFAKKHGADMVRVDGVGNEGDLLHVDNFLQCVRSRQQPTCPADLGYKVMATIDLSVRSYREGKVYYFDPSKEEFSQRS